MSAESTFTRSAIKYLRCPVERVQIIENCGAFDLSTMKDGVIILLALWSGPSVIAIAHYTSTLADPELELDPEIPVYIGDIDTLTNDQALILSPRGTCGVGEAAFFKNGVSEANMVGMNQQVKFVETWRSLFG